MHPAQCTETKHCVIPAIRPAGKSKLQTQCRDQWWPGPLSERAGEVRRSPGGFQGCETILYAAVMMDDRPVIILNTFVQTHRMYNTRVNTV